MGNILEDNLESILGSPLRAEFARLKSNISSECGDCRWMSFCNGDCTRYRRGASGNHDRQSEFCAAWKMLLKHIEPHAADLARRSASLRQAYQQNGLEFTPRNAPCPCGSGKKFKRCCGRESG
jgi:sulfatase maturation enzyme AslB (radical SAM superfamily)